jgi:heat-inducible transcriptional repressor
MLEHRAQVLLRTLVERYVAEGQPVGSRALSKYSGLDLSPATVRNVMADLEEMGFIASPHTSAGRVPTPRGYRFFVDTLMVVKSLEQVEIQQMHEQLSATNRQDLVNAAAQLLSELTHFAGVVMLPRRMSEVIRHLEFLRLSEKRILLILVTQEGEVQNRVLHTIRAYSQSELIEAANVFNANFAGKALDDIRPQLQQELKRLHQDMTALMNAAVEAGSEALRAPSEGLVVSGERNLLDTDDLATNMQSLRKLFELFEKKTALLHLLDLGQRSSGMQIYIGGESGVVALDECSIITAPYEVDGKVLGTLGVVGPTRMAYDRVIPIVDVTAKLLSNALGHQLVDH